MKRKHLLFLYPFLGLGAYIVLSECIHGDAHMPESRAASIGVAAGSALVVALFLIHRFIPESWFRGETRMAETLRDDAKYRHLLGATRLWNMVAALGAGVFLGLSMLNVSFWVAVWFAAVPAVPMLYFAAASAARVSELHIDA